MFLNRASLLGLSCKANICSDAGTGDLGVLTTHETSPCFSLSDAGSSISKWDWVGIVRIIDRAVLTVSFMVERRGWEFSGIRGIW